MIVLFIAVKLSQLKDPMIEIFIGILVHEKLLTSIEFLHFRKGSL